MTDFFVPPKAYWAEGYHLMVELARPDMDEALEQAARFFVEHRQDKLDPNRFSRPFGLTFVCVSALYSEKEDKKGEVLRSLYYRYRFQLLHESTMPRMF